MAIGSEIFAGAKPCKSQAHRIMSGRFLGQFFKFLSGNIFLTTANLIRDTSIAAAFGRTLATDHFFLAVTLLIFLVTVFGNACRSVYVPTLQTAMQQTPDQFEAIARRLSANNIRALTMFAAALSIGAGLFSLLGQHFANTQMKHQALIMLEIIPMYALSAFIEGSQGPLQTRGRIFSPGLMRLGLPLGIIAGIVFDGDRLGVHAIALGGLIGSSVSAAAILFMLHRNNMFPLSSPKLPPAIARAVRGGVLALLASSCIAYITPVIDIWMASMLGAGAASTLGYASRLTVGIASLLVGSLAPVFLII
jgi:peptidoglycan biosynthesis protein MviN/MurJ (putative lipid II flippase)